MLQDSTAGLRRRFDRRALLKLSGFGVASLVAAASKSGFSVPMVAANEAPPPFNIHDGNAPIEVIIPTVIPVIFSRVSPGAEDATLVLRITTIITNAWFDAIAPYHSTAVGVYSSIARQPGSEGTRTNKNIATLYASYRVLSSLLPNASVEWRGMLQSVGLDPDNNQQNSDNPIGIGNQAGTAIAAARENDGMNQLGNEGGVNFHRRPYADYTGYRPVNSAYLLSDAGRWQPDVLTTGEGLFQIQQHVTPQMRLTQSYTGLSLNQFKAPPPNNSRPNRPQYKQQLDEVLQASANLNDHQKMSAELFDNKLLSLGFSALSIYYTKGLSFHDFVQSDFLLNLAAFDTATVIWNEKIRFDAVRPFSAARHVDGDQPVTAWGGPGVGTVSIPGNQWRSYLQTADHSEYPSGSSGFCAAHAQASRRFLGSDDLDWSVPYSAGSSRIEPGISPATDIELHWDTWTEFENDCGMSRFWAGVHFLPSIAAAAPLGKAVGDKAYDFLMAHVSGVV
jgi:hypothetical protein